MTISSIICNLNYDPTITAGEFGVVIILLFTLVVVIVYTFATIGLWKQARKQTDLQISPFLNFDIDEKDQFFIKNYGNSPAFNVVVDRFSMVINDLPEKPVWKVEFKTIPFIGDPYSVNWR